MSTISIVDYGAGNIGSVVNMCKHIGVQAKVVQSRQDVEASEKILLPGVGAFDAAMEKLSDNGLIETLRLMAEKGTPLLGICLGMQLLCQGSEEGELSGLGLLPIKCEKFKAVNQLKVPHMGWNTVEWHGSHPLSVGLETDNRFYFVHSYAAFCTDSSYEIGRTNYGSAFASVIGSGNVFGTQFHPEKSHKFGMQILKNFSEY